MVRYIKKHSNNKGFTLIEIVLVIVVSSMVLLLISGIFITGTQIYRDIHNNIEIHQQANAIMDFMTSTIMSSNGIEGIDNYEKVSFYGSDEELELGAINLIDKNLKDGSNHTFTIQKDPKLEGRSIRYGENNVATIEVGNYIKSIYTKPLPTGCIYSDAKGIEITMEMKKGKSNITISKSMYFRKY